MRIQWNARTLLVAGLVCFNLMLLVALGLLLHKSRALYEEQAAMQTQNIAKALDQSISGSIEKIDITLHTVADELERQLVAGGKVDEQAMNAFMARQARRLPEIEGLRASNASGLIFLGKGVDRNNLATLADRDYFSYHRAHSERAVQVTKPLIGRVSRKHAIFFTQRYNYPDGRFAGVVVATFLIEHFEQLFSRFDLGAHGAIALRDRDLGLVARAPVSPTGPIGQSAVSPEFAKLYEAGVAAGTIRAVVTVDGVERTTTFRRLDRAPMTVLVGMAKEDYLAKWQTEIYQALATIVAFLSFSLLLGGWLFRLLAEAGRRERLLARSRDELLHYKDQLEETVQKRTAELILARDAAEAANKAKSVFLANMSHELRTPLNAILGFSSMMKRETHLSEAQRENIDIINRSGAHLLTLINDVLEIAKIEAGRLQLEIAPFDLVAMVGDVADMMRLRAQDKGLQLMLEMTPEVPRFIMADEARLRQILINLVGNAVKFTRQGGVTVRVGIHKNIRLLLVFEVEDSGPGIGDEDRKRIFRPFVQLAEGGEQTGTGLGLTITKQFIDLMGGSIDLESTVGKGSLFRVEIPVEPATSLELSEIRSDAHREIVGLAAGHPACRVLIVEDQYENRQLLNWLMTDIGIETRLAENGEACIKEFQDWHPDLIWMDRRMPVMDGEEATRRIRKLPGGDKVKIVAVTASAFREEQRQMLDAGMDDFVRKPYRPDEIYDCLAKHLNVRYRYGSGNGGQTEPAALTTGMLAGLPVELRQELKDAVISLDSERIAVVVGKAAEVDVELGRSLTRLVGNFDYPAILAALVACETG